MWALSKMLHCGPWPYGYKSCLSTTCCLFDHMEFWDILRSPTCVCVCVCVRVCMCVCEIETQFQIFFLLSVFRCYSLLKLGSVYSWVTNCTCEKKVWKMLLDAKKKRENWLKRATGYFQFFLEDASSIVTAYARIGSRCKVKAYFRVSPS